MNLLICMSLLACSCSGFRNLQDPCDKVRTVDGNKVFYVNRPFLPSFPVPEWIDRPLLYVNCSRRGLKNVPQMVSSKVEFLDLSLNFIKRFESADFSNYQSLVVLWVNGNCLNKALQHQKFCRNELEIAQGAFKNLGSLKWLNINSNNIRSFARDLPVSMRILDISFTFMSKVTTSLRHSLPNLEVLLAAENCKRGYKTFCPRNFTIMSELPTSLKVLNLEYNNWHRIPGYLLGSEIVSFVLNENPVDKLRNHDFMNATNLQRLELNSMMPQSHLILEADALIPLKNLKSLSLMLNGIYHIPPNFFKHNTKLEHLDLSLNCLGMTIFQPTYLSGLDQMKYLDLSSNALCVDIPVNSTVDELYLGSVFSTLTSLQYLMLGFAPTILSFRKTIRLYYAIHFARVNDQSFSSLARLSNLSVISISGCSVREAKPDHWRNLKNLKSVYASDNTLGYHNNSFRQDRSPQFALPDYLNSASTERRLASADVFYRNSEPSLYSHNNLDYSRNQISSISRKESLFLNAVVNLDLSHNQIKYIYERDLANLLYLSSLNLAYNPIKAIGSGSFQTLSYLQTLTMIDTDFVVNADLGFMQKMLPNASLSIKWEGEASNVQDTLLVWYLNKQNPYIESVQSADLSGNKMAFFKAGPSVHYLQPLRCVKRLSLRNCELESPMPDDLLSNFTNLETLDLRENMLFVLPTALLQHLYNLVELYLDHNRITELTGGLFSNLTLVKRLGFSSNKIGHIEAGFFQHSILLQYLDLSNNYIQRFDVLPRQILQSLTYLDIRWNDLDCSCEVWETFYLWYLSDESENTVLPGFLPHCSSDIDIYLGGCVACQSPWGLHGLSVATFGHNTSCELTNMVMYAATFTAFVLTFMVSGMVGYSKWMKRLIFRKVNEHFRVGSLQESIDSEDDYERQHRYQSLIFYDTENAEVGDWVDGCLVPKMKTGKPSIKLVVSGRDDKCGVSPTQQILQSVMQCHKTIVLLSNRFCDTPKCRFILTALQELQYSKGKDRMVLIALHCDWAPRVPESIERTLNRQRYCFLQFDRENGDETLFFDTLRTALLTCTDLGPL